MTLEICWVRLARAVVSSAWVTATLRSSASCSTSWWPISVSR